MPDATPDPVGVRVARARKQRGLTQHGLAQRTAYSRSHIAQVEAGHKVATPAFVAAVAGALGVDPADLYGQPFHLPGRAERIHSAIPGLRRSLIAVEIPPELEAPPRSLDELASELAVLRRFQELSQHSQIGVRLPALLEELAWHAHDSGGSRAWESLFRACEAGADLCRKLGHHDLATSSLEAARRAARHVQDPNLPLLVPIRRSLLLSAVGQPRSALTLLGQAVRAVDHDRRDAHEVLGTALLRSAVIAARAGDRAAWDYYGQAVEVREASGDEPGTRHGVTTGFTPGNVAIHCAAVAVELGDLDEAARRDQQIPEQTLASLIPERRAHHEVDMARVHMETGDHDKAMRRILRAEQTAPQMTRFHPSARTVVTHLVDVRRTIPEPLRGLKTRMGV
ncbi:helix-turn-helix domain-containing protein [Actinocorallia sp. B10E7]|uniref:helix-turn-helix domain-containing protein n=1 Tax=Actinocorallia sp. B10E7 TaxID=3153558 RepID=UPI00325DBA0F